MDWKVDYQIKIEIDRVTDWLSNKVLEKGVIDRVTDRLKDSRWQNYTTNQ